MRHNFDPGAAQATFEVYPKGDYEVIVGEPKAFERKKANSEDTTYGLRFPVKIASGEFEGKRTVYSAYKPDEVGFLVKQLLLAAFGYDKTQRGAEDDFNANEGVNFQWGYDISTGDVDEGWHQLTGKRVIASLDVGVNPNNNEPTQQFTGFRTL